MKLRKTVVSRFKERLESSIAHFGGVGLGISKHHSKNSKLDKTDTLLSIDSSTVSDNVLSSKVNESCNNTSALGADHLANVDHGTSMVFQVDEIPKKSENSPKNTNEGQQLEQKDAKEVEREFFIKEIYNLKMAYKVIEKSHAELGEDLIALTVLCYLKQNVTKYLITPKKQS